MQPEMSEKTLFSPRPIPANYEDFIPLQDWPHSPLPSRVPTAVSRELKLFSPKKADEIARALSKCQMESEHRVVQPGEFDFFALPGKYRHVERFSASPSVPSSRVQTWLALSLPAEQDPNENLWHLCASYTMALCVPRDVFIESWECLSDLATEAATVYPPSGKWILEWERDYRSFVLYRRNPDDIQKASAS